MFKTFAKIFLYLQGESQNGGNKKTQHTKFPKKKQILLTRCFHISSVLRFPFCIITNN